MDLLHTGTDCFFYPVELTGDDRLQFEDANSPATADIDGGVYTTIGGTDYLDLLAAVADAMSDASSQSFHMVRADIGSWSGWGTNILSGSSFSLDTDDEDSHRVLQLLGFPTDEGMLEATEVAESDYRLESTYPSGGVWRAPKPSDGKPTNAVVAQFPTGGHGAAIQNTRWGTDRIRTFEYTNIPAVHVVRGRQTEPVFASKGPLPTDDHDLPYQNYFYSLWEQGISTYSRIFAAYHLEGAIPLDWTAVADREVLISSVGSQYADEFTENIRRGERQSEHYDLEFGLRIESSEYGQY